MHGVYSSLPVHGGILLIQECSLANEEEDLVIIPEVYNVIVKSNFRRSLLSGKVSVYR